MEITLATQERIKVLELRLRIEKVAMEAYKTVCQIQGDVSTNSVGARLSFVLGLVPEESRHETLGIIRLARHVYVKSSDVLHGRSNMMNIPDVIVTEWQLIVSRLEDTLRGSQ
ncbi:hypothetical protein [Peterkaempfera bronchialis]|uniref:hypothetical protein n=1 Tax=Peterkaempfera bronchialis TaxID=2126346 RepID=UPI003C2C4330